MQFADREEAAKKLTEKLSEFQGKPETIVLALPRGGVVIGRIIADALKLPLDIIVPRKIGAQGNEEYAIGAITETGQAIWNEAERASADVKYLERKEAEEKKEAARRLAVYRKDRPPRNLQEKIVLLVDDGIATGLTMRAAISTAKSEGAKRVVVAVPVCPLDTLKILAQEADEVITLQTPSLFFAIGAFYLSFQQVEDEEVVRLLQRP